jgi:hypothetical protein
MFYFNEKVKKKNTAGFTLRTGSKYSKTPSYWPFLPSHSEFVNWLINE